MNTSTEEFPVKRRRDYQQDITKEIESIFKNKRNSPLSLSTSITLASVFKASLHAPQPLNTSEYNPVTQAYTRTAPPLCCPMASCSLA